jgi:hypothetical protein
MRTGVPSATHHRNPEELRGPQGRPVSLARTESCPAGGASSSMLLGPVRISCLNRFSPLLKVQLGFRCSKQRGYVQLAGRSGVGKCGAYHTNHIPYHTNYCKTVRVVIHRLPASYYCCPGNSIRADALAGRRAGTLENTENKWVNVPKQIRIITHGEIVSFFL